MVQRKTSLRLIEKAVSEKWVKPLALFHMLKFRYANSCIYSYRGRFQSISSDLDLSMKSMYSYIKILRSKGLVYDHKNNLIMKSVKAIKRDMGRLWNKCTLIIPDNYNLFDIECLLYSKILEDKAKRQAFKEAMRRFGRRDWRIRGLSETSFLASFSYRSVAKILNLSKDKAVKVIKKLNRMNVIASQNQKPKLKMKDARWLNIDFISDYPGHHFFVGDDLFQQYGCKHEFIQFPIILKRITMQQYIKQINRQL